MLKFQLLDIYPAKEYQIIFFIATSTLLSMGTCYSDRKSIYNTKIELKIVKTNLQQ